MLEKKIEEEKLPKKKVKCVILTLNDMKIEGDVFLPPEIRVSDELNVSQRKILVVENAKITSLRSHASGSINHKIAMVNKDNIICLLPVKE